MSTLTSAIAGSMLAPFNTAAANGQLKVYAGSVPANADAALGGAGNTPAARLALWRWVWV